MIVAAVVVGGWSARPLAQDHHSRQGIAASASDDHPHGALAQAVGYTPPFGCVSGPDRGAMGQHFVNLSLVADGELDAAHPELVVCEMRSGQLFHRNEAPNRYRLPAFYSLTCGRGRRTRSALS